jgi:hypothetical protein
MATTTARRHQCPPSLLTRSNARPSRAPNAARFRCTQAAVTLRRRTEVSPPGGDASQPSGTGKTPPGGGARTALRRTAAALQRGVLECLRPAGS